MSLLSQRAYARHREEQGLPGKTLRAVQKAIEAGRIQLTAEGLIDPVAADAAWERNSSTGHRRGKHAQGKGEPKKPAPKKTAAAKKAPAKKPAAPAPAPARPPKPLREPPQEIPEDDLPTGAYPGMPLAEASALEKVWKAKLAELEYMEKSGQLVRAEEIAARWAEILTISKTKLLAVPAKAKARIPRLTAADVGIIDELVREALEELADTELEEHDEEGDDGS